MSTSQAARIPIYANLIDRELTAEQPSITEGSITGADDESLMLRMQTSDMEALGLLFHRYSRLTFMIARRILRDNDEAEDVVQDVFLSLFFKSKAFDPAKGCARSWLVQIAHHRAYDRRRWLCTRSFYNRTRNNNAAGSLVSSGNGRGDDAENFFAWQSHLQPAFDELSEDQRKTLMLYFYEGYTIREISEKLGQSFGNVQHHYYRGMDRLRKYVFEKNGE